MSHKLIITNLFQKRIIALLEEDSLIELECEEKERKSLLGNIYIGKVKNIVQNIRAAFVEIENGQMCYYSFEDNKNPVILNKRPEKDTEKNNIKIGDELLVQVSKEAMKTKEPMVTSNINLPGKYVVLTTGNKQIGISSKIKEPAKSELKAFMEAYRSENYGFVVRTNAADADKEQIKEEVRQLSLGYEKLLTVASHRTCFSLLFQSLPSFLKKIRDVYSGGLEEIISDDREAYDQIKAFLEENQWEAAHKLRFYEDSSYSLAKLYNLETQIKEGLKDKVWLKSGGFLIIQQAEACSVIDVNSGKFTGKKKGSQAFFHINREAAGEIARQIRLRNISGIILIDFIDMETDKEKSQLLAMMNEYVGRDPIQTTVIDMTALQIMEITRKKVRRTLKEELAASCPVCHGAGYIY